MRHRSPDPGRSAEPESKGYYEIIKPLIEQELSLKVVGYFPDQREMHLESRHLGLVLPDELADIRKQLRETADCLAETIDLDALTEIAAHAEELDGEETAIAQHPICCTIANCQGRRVLLLL